MDLSPNDIRNYEFSNQMRGYDKEEVDNLLEQIAQVLDKTKQDNLKLEMEVDSLKAQVNSLKQFEDTIKNAAIDARRNADTTIAGAKAEAAQIVAQAHQEADNIIKAQAVKLSEFDEQLGRLEATKKSFISKLRGLINGHMDMIDEIASEDIKKDLAADSPRMPMGMRPSDPDALEVMESTDITRGKMETMSDEPVPQSIRTEQAIAPEMTPDVLTAEEELTGVADTGRQQVEIESSREIDPELVAALENYKNAVAEKPAKKHQPPVRGATETTRRAEDIPPGFIVREDVEPSKVTDPNETDRHGTAPESQDVPTEHNKIDIDAQEAREREAVGSITPDKLAEALDSVVAKFEEEIEKAEKR